jgi:hypothetical protein
MKTSNINTPNWWGHLMKFLHQIHSAKYKNWKDFSMRIGGLILVIIFLGGFTLAIFSNLPNWLPISNYPIYKSIIK